MTANLETTTADPVDHVTAGAEALAEAKRVAGSAKALAVGLGIIPASLQQWKRVPAERVLAVEKITKIPRYRLRPDIYPAPKPRKKAAARG